MTRTAYLIICTVLFIIAMIGVSYVAKAMVGTWGAWVAIPWIAGLLIVGWIWERKEKANKARLLRQHDQSPQ